MTEYVNIAEASIALVEGRPAIFPTDTVFGLGISPLHADSPEIIYQLKHRESRKPIAWLVGALEDLTTYGVDVPEFAQVLARTFWPGPLTLIVRASDAVPQAFRSAEGTIGLRMPANPTALTLISQVGGPLATTSANPSGKNPPHAPEEIDPDLAAAVGVVVVDDQEKSGIASTILDCTGEHPVILRAGAITAQDIAALS